MLQQLISERDQYRDAYYKYKALDEVIQKLSGVSHSKKPPESHKEYSDYKKGGSMQYKVRYALQKLNRFSHSSEIKAFLGELEGVPSKNFVVSASLSSLKRAKKLHKHQEGSQQRNSFWGSTNWLDEEGRIKPKYLFDETLLSSNEVQPDLFEDF